MSEKQPFLVACNNYPTRDSCDGQGTGAILGHRIQREGCSSGHDRCWDDDQGKLLYTRAPLGSLMRMRTIWILLWHSYIALYQKKTVVCAGQGSHPISSISHFTHSFIKTKSVFEPEIKDLALYSMSQGNKHGVTIQEQYMTYVGYITFNNQAMWVILTRNPLCAIFVETPHFAPAWCRFLLAVICQHHGCSRRRLAASCNSFPQHHCTQLRLISLMNANDTGKRESRTGDCKKPGKKTCIQELPSNGVQPTETRQGRSWGHCHTYMDLF